MTKRRKDGAGADRDADSPERTQVAVALSHDRDGNAAPTVVATGRGAVADQILEIAFANGVRVREDADLAEILSIVEQDSEVPVAAFAAVAEILNYVYRLNANSPARPGGTTEQP